MLTTEWVDGLSWERFVATASQPTKQRAAEVIWRFAQHSVHRVGVFNGDPHPGNYRFHHDGSVTFLDFGLVKRWTPGELEGMEPALDAILARDAPALVRAMEASGFLRPAAGVDPDLVFAWMSAPYVPYMSEEFTFTREWLAHMLGEMINVTGERADVLRHLNVPPSFVILDRVVWGVSALLARLGASGPYRGILQEYRVGAPPATELGHQEAAWRAERAARHN